MLPLTQQSTKNIDTIVPNGLAKSASNISGKSTIKDSASDPFGPASLHGKCHELSVEDVLRILDVSPEKGLTMKQVEYRQNRDGLNSAPLVSLVDEINLFQGAMRMCPTTVTVLRDGDLSHIPSTKLVLGDIVVYQAGQKIESDCRILSVIEKGAVEDVHGITEVDVSPSPEPMGYDQYTAHNLAYSGCKVVRGKFVCVVTATGARCAVHRLRKEEETLKQAKYRKLNPIMKLKCSRAMKKLHRKLNIQINSPEALFRMGEVDTIVTGTFGLRKSDHDSTKVTQMSIGVGSPVDINRLRQHHELFASGVGHELVNACVLGTLSIANVKEKEKAENVEKFLRSDHDSAIIHFAQDVKKNCTLKRVEYKTVGKTYKSYSRPYTIVMNQAPDSDELYIICQGSPKVLLEHCSYIAHEDNLLTRRASSPRGTFDKELKKAFSQVSLEENGRHHRTASAGSQTSQTSYTNGNGNGNGNGHSVDLDDLQDYNIKHKHSTFGCMGGPGTQKRHRFGRKKNPLEANDCVLTPALRQKVTKDIEETMREGIHAIAFIRTYTKRDEIETLDGAELDDLPPSFCWLGMVCLDTAAANAKEMPGLVRAVQDHNIRIVVVSNSDPELVRVQATRAGILDKDSVVHNSQDAVTFNRRKMAEIMEDTSRKVAFGGGNRALMTKLVVDALQDIGERVCLFDESDSSYLVHTADVGCVPGIDGSDRAREGADIIVEDNRLATLLRTVDLCCTLASNGGSCRCQ